MPTQLQPLGELIDVNGRKVHGLRNGTGSPVVLFESGLMADSFVFAKVQPEVAKLTSTISYDRAGLGYSELISNRKQTSVMITSELFDLIEILGLDEPMILVGWSAGGLYVREFTYQHPEKVAGLVLIDGSSENGDNSFPVDLAKILNQNRKESIRVSLV